MVLVMQYLTFSVVLELYFSDRRFSWTKIKFIKLKDVEFVGIGNFEGETVFLIRKQTRCS